MNQLNVRGPGPAAQPKEENVIGSLMKAVLGGMMDHNDLMKAHFEALKEALTVIKYLKNADEIHVLATEALAGIAKREEEFKTKPGRFERDKP